FAGSGGCRVPSATRSTRASSRIHAIARPCASWPSGSTPCSSSGLDLVSRIVESARLRMLRAPGLRKLFLSLLTLGAWSTLAGGAQAAPFPQCPHIGAASSCRILIVLNADGTTSVSTDSSIPAYDGVEDVTVGIVNQTAFPISTVQLSSTEPIFGFD